MPTMPSKHALDLLRMSLDSDSPHRGTLEDLIALADTSLGHELDLIQARARGRQLERDLTSYKSALTRSQRETSEARTHWRDAEATARHANEAKALEVARVVELRAELRKAKAAAGRAEAEARNLRNAAEDADRRILTARADARAAYRAELEDQGLTQANPHGIEALARKRLTEQLAQARIDRDHARDELETSREEVASLRGALGRVVDERLYTPRPILGEVPDKDTLEQLKANAGHLTHLPDEAPASSVAFTGTARMSPATRAKLAAENYTTSRTYVLGGPVDWPEVARAATIRADRAERKLAKAKRKRAGIERELKATRAEARDQAKLANRNAQLVDRFRGQRDAAEQDPARGLALAADLLRLLAEHPHGIEVATERDNEVKRWDGHVIRTLDLGGELTIKGRRA